MMELDDLKNTWNAPQHNNLRQETTRTFIDRVTTKKYQSKINRIIVPELAGSLICLLAVVYTAIHFNELNTLFLQGTGILCIALLLALSAISAASLRSLLFKKDVSRPYAATLKLFAAQKQRFYQLQKINITLSYLLLVTVIILFSKFFGGTDITGSKYFWTFAFSLGYIFLLFFSKYVTRFYKKTLQQTQELLQELDSPQ
jgi:hypothetical protein